MYTFLWCVVAAFAFIYLYMYAKRDDLLRRQQFVFISENLVFLQAGIDQVDKLKQKYCPENQHVTQLLKDAQEKREAITEALIMRSDTLASTRELMNLSANLREALFKVSVARHLVMKEMTPEQLEDEDLLD